MFTQQTLLLFCSIAALAVAAISFPAGRTAGVRKENERWCLAAEEALLAGLEEAVKNIGSVFLPLRKRTDTKRSVSTYVLFGEDEKETLAVVRITWGLCPRNTAAVEYVIGNIADEVSIFEIGTAIDEITRYLVKRYGKTTYQPAG